MASSGATPIGYDDRGTGPALVLLHPFPLTRTAWAGLADALAAHRRVIAVDARGFGESPLAGPFAIADIADDVAALLDRLAIARATVLGHVDGRLRRARLRRPPPRAAVGAGAGRHARRRRQRRGARRPRRRARHARRRAGRPPTSPASCRACCRRTRRPRWSRTCARAPRRAPPACAPASRRCATAPTASAELGAIACPTLVVCGTEDQVTPAAEMKQIAAAIAGARFVPIAGAGHLSHVEAPGAFLHAVTSFLDTVDGGAAVMKLDATFFDRVRGAAHAASEQLAIDGADVAVVLGSGLGGVADRLEGARSVPYASLPGFPGDDRRRAPGAPGRRARSRARPRCCCAGASTATRATRPARSASACASSPRSACAR